MKNITNLDIKRQRVGLIKELSSLALLELYKKANSKVKLEMLALLEVLKHTEKASQEVITLIYKLERVPDRMSLISKLSKKQFLYQHQKPGFLPIDDYSYIFRPVDNQF